MHVLIPVHIAAAILALLAGSAALASRKGAKLHRRSGRMFAAAMLVMFSTAVAIGVVKSERNLVLVLSSVVGGYLVATSWATARKGDGTAGSVELLGLGVILSCVAAYVFLGVMAAGSPTGRYAGLGQTIILPNLAITALAASLDLSFLYRRRLAPGQRLARHVWRMCAAMFLVVSAFLGDGQGQSPVPDVIRQSPIAMMGPVAVIGMMVFWLLRLRFPERHRRAAAWFAARRRGRGARNHLQQHGERS
jgi:hypothetical protein